MTDFVPVNVEREDSSMLNNFKFKITNSKIELLVHLTKNPQKMRRIDDLLWISSSD